MHPYSKRWVRVTDETFCARKEGCSEPSNSSDLYLDLTFHEPWTMSNAVIIINGFPGVGKTSVAHELA